MTYPFFMADVASLIDCGDVIRKTHKSQVIGYYIDIIDGGNDCTG